MKKYQLAGIGNAVVDVISRADDSFLDHMGIEKGIMQLVERERAEVLYGAMDDRVQAPGGSVANTLAGLGNLGLRTAFIGRVKDDALGRFYAQAMADDPQFLTSLQSLEDAVDALCALPGIGPWTAQYIAMRALREPDAFPAADVGLFQAMEKLTGDRPDAKVLQARAESWRPWRAYAAQHLWAEIA